MKKKDYEKEKREPTVDCEVETEEDFDEHDEHVRFVEDLDIFGDDKQKTPCEVDIDEVAEEYIEELRSGKRLNDYVHGDPNCRSFEIDYMSPEIQEAEHKRFMEELDKVGQIVDEMIEEREKREKEKPNGLQERKEKLSYIDLTKIK